MNTKVNILGFIKSHYPITPTKVIAQQLEILPHKVRYIAKKNNIHKSKEYLLNIQRDLKGTEGESGMKEIYLLFNRHTIKNK
ncbi:hypothetical protein [Oceanobacillus kapialis]|uniref:hypothetical protein n=1 Tax=Oceanobacillus kapialis TaxID=481353 RepID=UPI00384ADB28